MVIIGVDPGTATTGWGVVRYDGLLKNKKTGKPKKGNNNLLTLIDFGCIVTESKEKMEDRLLVLNRSLKRVMKEHNPDHVVIEQLFFGPIRHRHFQLDRLEELYY